MRLELEDFNDYQIRALMSLQDKGHASNILHSVMGMTVGAGKVFEIKNAGNLLPTLTALGECMWYCAILARELGLKLEDVLIITDSVRIEDIRLEKDTSQSCFEIDLMMCASRMLGSQKNSIFYDKPLDTENLKDGLVRYISCLLALSHHQESNLLVVCSINIESLMPKNPVGALSLS